MAKVSMDPNQDYGANTRECLAFCDPDTPSLRTFQLSFFGGCIEFSGTLPRSGLMRSGRVYPRQPLVLLTKETGFSLWPTPLASDGKRMKFSREQHLKHHARNIKEGFGGGAAALNLVVHIQIEFDGYPTANFVEWLMGFPTNWSAIEDSETPLCPKSPSGSDDASLKQTGDDQ